jgi:hypothetical protein
MKRSLWLAILGLPLGFASLLAVQSAQSQTPESGGIASKNSAAENQHPKKSAEKKENTSDTKPAVSQPAPILNQQPPATSLNSNTSQYNQDTQMQGKIVTFTFWLVIVGAVQAVILALTIGAIYSQTTTTKNSERAWVLVKRIGNPEQWYAPEQPEYSPGMVFEFKVSGKTPARVIRADFRLHPVPAKVGVRPPEPDLPVIPEYKSGARNPEIPEAGRVLPPDEVFQVRLGLYPPTLTEEQWLNLRDNKAIMCAYGFIEYKDVFGREGKTQACYVYDFAWGGVITAPDGTRLNPPGFRIGGPRAYNQAR